MLFINLSTISEISLLPSFGLNIWAILIVSIVHFTTILFVTKNDYANQVFTKRWGKWITTIMIYGFCFASSLLVVMSFKMNFNYYLRSDSTEDLNIIVVNKRISHGRATDYYIDFQSNEGKLSYKTNKSDYVNRFKIGEKYVVVVSRGFFEGFFLEEKLK